MTTLRQHPLIYLLIALGLIAPPLNAGPQSLSTGGFVSVGYLQSSHYNYLADTDEGTFDFVEAGLNASWTPANRTTVNGQAFLFEFGPYGNYQPLIDYLFIDYSHSKTFGIRAGRIKRELGLYTHIQDIDVSRSSILLPHGIYDPRYRDLSASLDGIAFYGTLDLPWSSRFYYNLYGGAIELETEGGIAGLALTELSNITVNNKIEKLEIDSNIGAQFWYYPNIEGLRFGYAISRYNGVDIATRGTFPSAIPDPFLAGKDMLINGSNIIYEFHQYSVEYYIDNWTFTSEMQKSTAEASYQRTIGGITFPDNAQPSRFHTWTASAARRFGKLEVGLTYTAMPNKDSPNETGNSSYQNDHQVSLRYDVNDHWTLKVEAHSIEGTKRLFNQYGQNPVLDQNSWTLWAAKSTFTF